jgi:type I restriction enzyme, S subunit
MTKTMNIFEKLLAKLCPDGVGFKELGELADIYTGEQLNKTAMFDEGMYPVLNGGINPSGRYDDYNTEAETIAISQGGASAGYVNFVKEQFWAGAHCFIVNPTTDIVINKFIYFVLKNGQDMLTNAKLGAGIPGLNRSELKNFKIPIPPLAIQQEIVKSLDTFTTLEAELEAELEARKKQYEYYREELLTFGDEVERKTLGEVCLKTENIKWKENPKTEYQYIDLSSVSRENNKILETQTINSTNAPSRAQQIVKKDDVIFGTTRPTLKRYSLINSKNHNQICSTGFCVLRANQNMILPKYLFFILKSNNFYNFVENNQEGAGYPSISNSKVKQFPIPIPPLAEQARIVAILDKFDALANDILIGLPAELYARRKQYEYYRGKLLTFKPLEKEYAKQ